MSGTPSDPVSDDPGDDSRDDSRDDTGDDFRDDSRDDTGTDRVRQVVVGVALIRSGRVLAALRPPSPTTPGGWEFPGGKVEPGETDEQAAVRELHEELGVQALIGPSLGEQPMGERYLLRVYAGRITAGEPVPHEHTELRWLAETELYDVAWLAADRPFLEPLRRSILSPSGPSRFGFE